MSLTKTTYFVYLLCYVLVSSQLLFYLFILTDALRPVSLSNFIELRKSVDFLAEHRLRVLYYVSLPLSIATVALLAPNRTSPLFITAVISCLCLLIDMAFALKGNMPINAQINNYTPNSGTNWEALRQQWLTFMQYRGVAIAIGITSLLAGLFLNQKS